MKISDFMDLKMLQKIQDQFSDATGLAAIATDAEGNYITEGSNFTDFCMKYTRNSIEGARRCVKCDTECKGTYFCHAGLMDFAADIIVDGEKVGAIIGGQVLPTEPDENKFREIAKELSINPDDYIAALKKVPVRSEKSIRAAAGMLGDVINQVVNLEYLKYCSNRRLNIFDDELESATKTVDVINQKTKELESIASKQNILALNASIESARAGVAGAGFAVVAKQMGELANVSAGIHREISDAAKQIKASVEKMNQKK
ncbi:MAG: PocR ligand-binding domain-containing protein [Lachnospiraceae bacterium]|nr:PocR ligand-binding domain-containing protein [Lachnospiraceae bacterium]